MSAGPRRLPGDSRVYWNSYRKVWWFISPGGIVWERKPGKGWSLGTALLSTPATRISLIYCP